MRALPAVLPAPVAPPVGPPPYCAACATTDGPFERATVPTSGGLSVVQRCVDPVTCHDNAATAGTWCTYDPTA